MKGTCLKGRYLLGEVIGKGGMAVVYKAYDFRTGRTVAVKVLRDQYSQDAEFVRRFQQEAEAASAITHENLIDIYDVGEQNGTRFIVMEYVDGMTLKSLIKEHGALDNYSAITIARQICTAEPYLKAIVLHLLSPAFVSHWPGPHLFSITRPALTARFPAC